MLQSINMNPLDIPLLTHIAIPKKAIGFLNMDCGLVHRNICLSSVFVDEAGEWKLGGVEFMHPFGDSHVPQKSRESLRRYDPPEASKPSANRRIEKW